MKEKIEDTLLELGITPASKGFFTLCTAIEIVVKDGCTQICKEVYPEVAKRHYCTFASVERSIRTAISKTNFEKYREMGGSCLKNKDFIMTLALKIRREINNEQN